MWMGSPELLQPSSQQSRDEPNTQRRAFLRDSERNVAGFVIKTSVPLLLQLPLEVLLLSFLLLLHEQINHSIIIVILSLTVNCS